MKGRAPKRSATGSHVDVQRKLHPKAARASAERRSSTTAMVPAMAMTESAKASERARNAGSPSRLGRRARAGATRTAGEERRAARPVLGPSGLDHRERLLLECDHGRRQRRVVERCGELL